MALSYKQTDLEDDAREPETFLVLHRLPWLVVGLLGGMLATLIASRFETLIATNINLAFFIPVIVYMADAVGSQTETIYVRNLAKKQISFLSYALKEFVLGVLLGSFFGIMVAIFSYFWFKNAATSITVGLAMFASMAIAPVVALIVPTILQKYKYDPAVGAGPFTTIMQDLLSLLIYFSIASFILFT